MRAEGPSRLVAIALVAAVASMVAFVVWVLVSPIDLPFQHVDATIQMTPRVDGHTVHVTGTANLPDGSLIDWYLWRETLRSKPPAGQVVVNHGAFAFDADVSGWAAGPAQAQVSFSCNYGTVQPKSVTEVVGGECEHLASEQVYVDSPGDSKQLFVWVRFTLP